MNQLDFAGLSGALLSRARELVSSWLPGGRMIGREYVTGSLRGGAGDSCKVNCDTGRWADFSTDDKGGDLTSLYAKIQGLTQGKAARQLAEQIGFRLDPDAPKVARQTPTEHVITTPPEGVMVPPMIHAKHGPPSGTWCYRTPAGDPIFYVARYDTPEGKQFSPWSWSSTFGRWVQKGYPEPRPLYGLELLAANPSKAVLIVEGEKAADAARKLADRAYVVVTWSNGSKAFGKTDWKPAYGRKVLIWPDWDAPGRDAAQNIAIALAPHCPEVKVIQGDPEEARCDGWDAADAVSGGMDWKQFVDWARPKAKIVVQSTAVAHANGKTATAAVQTNVHVDVHTEAPDETSPSAVALWEELGIVCNGQGSPICNIDNALRVIERFKDFDNFVWYDEFHNRTFTTWRSNKPREWGDVDDIKLATIMQREFGLRRMSDDLVHKAIVVYSRQRARNEPRDWFNSLTWDGTNRVETFFIDCVGSKDSEYTRAAAHNFWVGMVARVCRPGCQLDNMIVLEGKQGTGKTNTLRIIGGPWHTEAHESVTSKDFFAMLNGKMIIEIAELDSFSRAEVTRIKQVITCTTDRYRASYGRVAEDHPRMCVFVGSTNEDSYLRDNTGARRFWPIKCGDIDTKRTALNREQLFAEAVARFKQGETWHEMPADDTAEEQEKRRQSDEWESVIYDYLLGKSETTMRDIVKEGLGIDLGKMDMAVQFRVGRVMKALGWKKHKDWNSGDQRKVWRKVGANDEPVPF